MLVGIDIFKSNSFVYKKGILYNNIERLIDVELCNWLFKYPLEKVEYTTKIQQYYRWYYDVDNINDIIPIVLHIEYCRLIVNTYKDIIEKVDIEDKSLQFYNDIVLTNYFKIEDSGLNVDSNLTEHFFGIKSTKLYTEYNMFTSTGRPSNRFNGINFAALNKSTGVRSTIIRENETTKILELDYDSHHLRLAANLIGYEFPMSDVHIYLGRQYFSTPILTDEQRNSAKEISFKTMYSDTHEYSNISFFTALDEYKNKLWSAYISNGYVETPIGKRKLSRDMFTDMYRSKLFNYILQSYETEVNNLILHKILNYLYTKHSKLLLYTYDAFTFMFDIRDGKELITDLLEITNHSNLLVRMKVGNNYNELRKINIQK